MNRNFVLVPQVKAWSEICKCWDKVLGFPVILRVSHEPSASTEIRRILFWSLCYLS